MRAIGFKANRTTTYRTIPINLPRLLIIRPLRPLPLLLLRLLRLIPDQTRNSFRLRPIPFPHIMTLGVDLARPDMVGGFRGLAVVEGGFGGCSVLSGDWGEDVQVEGGKKTVESNPGQNREKAGKRDQNKALSNHPPHKVRRLTLMPIDLQILIILMLLLIPIPRAGRIIPNPLSITNHPRIT